MTRLLFCPNDRVHLSPDGTFLKPVLDGVRLASHNLAAKIASPGNPSAVDSAISAANRAALRGNPTPENSLLEAYVSIRGDDSPEGKYQTATSAAFDAYRPAEKRFDAAVDDLYAGLDRAYGFQASKRCTDSLLALYEAYMIEYEDYRFALDAYLDDIRDAIERYLTALERAWVS